MDLALNNLRSLIRHKNQPTIFILIFVDFIFSINKTKTRKKKFIPYITFFFFIIQRVKARAIP